MCKLRKSSALIFVFLSPGIGCYLSVITFPQEQMTTIPDPVANIACAEETTLMSSRKRKGWGGQCSPMDRIKPKVFNLTFLSAASARRKLVGPLPRSRPPGQLADVESRIPYQRGQPFDLLPSPSRTGRTGSSQSPGQRRGEGQATRRQPPRFLSPPSLSALARRRAEPSRVGELCSPCAAGWGGWRRPRSVPGADHHAIVVGPFGPRAAQPPGAEHVEPREEE